MNAIDSRLIASSGGRRRCTHRQLRAPGARARAQTPQTARSPPLPGSLKDTPMLDSWIRIDADGSVTVFTGKAELGQGIKTALLQVAAEELGVPMEHITLVTADTARTPNEGYTSGSQSMSDSATAIRNAAAQVREILLARAAERMSVNVERIKIRDGVMIADDGSRLPFGELVGDDVLHVRAQPASKFKEPSTYTVMGKPVARVDIPAKVTGGVAYVHDLRLPGMVHARVVRPPNYGARLIAVDAHKVAVHARRTHGRPRRQLPRRDRRARISGDHGDASAGGGGALERVVAAGSG